MGLNWYSGYMEFKSVDGTIKRYHNKSFDAAIKLADTLPDGTEVMYFPSPIAWKPEDYRS